MNEYEKMSLWKIYDPNKPELATKRLRAHNLCLAYNKLEENDPQREEILKELHMHNEGLFLQGPIYCDYGENIKFGKGCYANFNFMAIDVCPIEIGDRVYFGPNVSLQTPLHPLLANERAAYFNEGGGYITDKEYGKPIKIGSDCWICANVTIIGGVNIGEGCVIGAGSVVTRDIPPHSLAFGNPARVIRELDENDSIYLKKELF